MRAMHYLRAGQFVFPVAGSGLPVYLVSSDKQKRERRS
jgi:hypothetical protein